MELVLVTLDLDKEMKVEVDVSNYGRSVVDKV